METEFLLKKKWVELPTRGLRGYWYLTAVFACCAVVATRMDAWVAKSIHLERMPGDLVRLIKLSEFFAQGFGVVVVAAGIWMLAREHRWYIPRLVTCAVLPALTIGLVKLLIGRQRPKEYHGNLPDTTDITWLGWMPGGDWNLEYVTQSFPSAHTGTAFGLAIGLSWLFPRGRVLFYSLATLAAAQRVVFNAHWFSDIVAGLAIATMMGGALTQNWGLGYFFGKLEKLAHPEKDDPDIRLYEPQSESEFDRTARRAA